ncbi:hypothetical protein MRBLWH7_002345 [Microbacterium sp. LWH7-1.2]|uniref:hypothetical protein n=1 Tax=Microbacterium sp. LWH7-1.2 TaxID=3135257 RepID=UPI003138D87B
MDFSDDAPQLGLADVDREALAGRGIALTELTAELGVALDASSAGDAPTDGWRVLKSYQSGAMVIGAPVDPSGDMWRVAHVEARVAGSLTIVQPDPLPLRPSRAERRRGLELRWPALMSSEPPSQDFVVDILNTGSTRWGSAADGFYVAGAFTSQGGTDFAFGWMGSDQYKSVPLDPGEYARVSVSINPGVWNTLEPGVYELHAVLVSLGLRTADPLRVQLSAETIARNRKRSARPSSSAAHRRRMLDQQTAHVQAQSSARDALDRLAAAVLAAEADPDAIASISRILGVDEKLATAVYHSTLRDLGPDSDRRDKQLARLIAERDA